MKKFNLKNIILISLLVLACIVGIAILLNVMLADEALVYSDVIYLFDNDHVVSFECDASGNAKILAHEIMTDKEGVKLKNPDGSYKFVFKDDGTPSLKKYSYKLSNTYQLEEFHKYAVDGVNPNLEEYDFIAPKETPVILSYLPYILIGVVLVGFWIYMARQANNGKGNSFSKAKTKQPEDQKNRTKFADVAGADEEKEELEEIVEFLKNPQKFVRLGAKIPRGVLLAGPPGTGKTLLAKAVAGEAGVPFLSISGSDFVEMYVGVGASRVRDLFDSARKSSPAIIFIDEIDAVGRQRGTGLGGGHDEREQTLNQLLVEMDGFSNDEGIIVIAATNRPDVLDPALLRPGRFDRQVTVNYPDIKGREAILRVHVRNKPLEGDVDLEKIAQTTVGFTGADLANLMNEAALLAAKRNKNLIGMKDIEDSYMKVILGPQKKSKIRTPEDNKLAAYHEAGHAVAAYYSDHADPVKHITIIPAGNAGGVTLMVPEKDKLGRTKNEMLDNIVVDLGGRVAEELVLDDISTGASNDIQQATKVARNMVTRYGMSDKLGTVLYGSEHSDTEVFLGRDFSSGKNYSEKTASEIDEEIRRIVEESHNRCRKYLSDNIDKLHFVAEYLLKYEFMDGETFKLAMTGEYTIEQLNEINEAKRRRSEEENLKFAGELEA